MVEKKMQVDLAKDLKPFKIPLIKVKRMAWINLVIAGLLEIAWTIGLKYTEGMSRLVPSIFTVAR